MFKWFGTILSLGAPGITIRLFHEVAESKCSVVDFSATIRKSFSIIRESFAGVKQVWLSCVSLQRCKKLSA